MITVAAVEKVLFALSDFQPPPTGTYINLLGYEVPDRWEPSLLAVK